MPQPSWRERVAYSPNDSERSLLPVRQTGTADEPPLAASPVLSNLLLASTGSAGKVTSNGVVPHPLPANLRKLDQLWSALYLLTARQSGHVAPDALARILSALQDTVDLPFGIEFPLEIDFEVIESAQEDSILAASVDYRGLYGIVQAGAWQDVTAGPGSGHNPIPLCTTTSETSRNSSRNGELVRVRYPTTMIHRVHSSMALAIQDPLEQPQYSY